METKNLIFLILVGIVVLVSLVPVISTLIGQADNQYECNAPFDIQCSATRCSNQSYVCNMTIAPLTIFNTSTTLCTNRSGVGIVNETPISGCLVTGYHQVAEDVGLNAGEVSLLYLVLLFLVLGLVFMVVKETGLLHRK